MPPKKRTTRRRTRKSHKAAAATMTMTELQFIAKSRGIPFGGLTKSKLIKKINDYS